MSYSEYYSLESSSDSSLCEKKKRFFDKYFLEEKSKMFKAKFNDKKFKTNVRLCINRLKLVEKKKTEMALKARKEIADYIKISKTGIFSAIEIVHRSSIKEFRLKFSPKGSVLRRFWHIASFG